MKNEDLSNNNVRVVETSYPPVTKIWSQSAVFIPNATQINKVLHGIQHLFSDKYVVFRTKITKNSDFLVTFWTWFKRGKEGRMGFERSVCFLSQFHKKLLVKAVIKNYLHF